MLGLLTGTAATNSDTVCKKKYVWLPTPSPGQQQRHSHCWELAILNWEFAMGWVPSVPPVSELKVMIIMILHKLEKNKNKLINNSTCVSVPG